MWFTRMNYLEFVISMFLAITVPTLYAGQPPALTPVAQATGSANQPAAGAPVQAAAPVTAPVQNATAAAAPHAVVNGPVAPAVIPAANLAPAPAKAPAPAIAPAPVTTKPAPVVPVTPAASQAAQIPAAQSSSPAPAAAVTTPSVTAPVASATAALTAPAVVASPAPVAESSAQPAIANAPQAPVAPTNPVVAPSANPAVVSPEVSAPAKPAEIPAPPVAQAPSKQELELGEQANIIGIDTVELQEGQGNWLFKRMWWERSEDKYEKIRKTVATIMEARNQFFEKRTTAEKNIFDNIHVQTGFERGELEDLVNRLMDRMNKLRENEPTLDEKEREFYAQLQTEKKALEALKANVNTINALENSIDDVLAKLMETINRVREYEQEAWQNFKDIARLLDDRKAKEMFYKIDATWRNVTSLKEYIQTRLSAHFDQLIAKSKEEADRVAKNLKDLKEKGFNLQKQEEAIIQYDREKEIAKIRAQEKERLEAEEAAKEEEKEEEGFFTAYIWNPIKAVVTWPYYAIFGESEQEEEEAETKAKPEDKVPAKEGSAVAPAESQANKAQSEQVTPEKQQTPGADKAQKPQEPEVELEGFLTKYIINPLKAVWSGIVSVITWPYYALFGEQVEQETEAPMESTAAVTSEVQAVPVTPTTTQSEIALSPQEPSAQPTAENTAVAQPMASDAPVASLQQSPQPAETTNLQLQQEPVAEMAILPTNDQGAASKEQLPPVVEAAPVVPTTAESAAE